MGMPAKISEGKIQEHSFKVGDEVKIVNGFYTGKFGKISIIKMFIVKDGSKTFVCDVDIPVEGKTMPVRVLVDDLEESNG